MYVARVVEQHASKVVLMDALVVVQVVLTANKKGTCKSSLLHVPFYLNMAKERTITFIVTKDCQLVCKYCYLVGKNPNEKMTLDVAKKAVDKILENSYFFNEERVVWDFIGGEPLLEIDLITNIVDYIEMRLEALSHHWKNNYGIRITTNGLLYKSQKVQNFISKYQNILNLSISIDGTKRKQDLNRVFPNGKGSYDIVSKSVKLWSRQFDNIATKMVISSEDLPFVAESGIHLLELGIIKLDMNLVVEDVWHEGDDLILEEQLIKFADEVIDKGFYKDRKLYIFEECIGHPFNPNFESNPCGSMMLSIDSHGNFYTCLRFAQYSLRSKQARYIGNIKDGINYNLLRPFYIIDELSQSPLKCQMCDVATGCRWCPAENYDASSTSTIFERSTAICKMHKARVRAKNYYWNKLKYKKA